MTRVSSPGECKSLINVPYLCVNKLEKLTFISIFAPFCGSLTMQNLNWNFTVILHFALGCATFHLSYLVS